MTETRTDTATLTITRLFDAPREMVYAAWTEPEQLAAWMGPTGFTAHSVTGDLRPGGRFQSAIRSEAGEDLWSGGEYHEVDPPERLVFTFAWEEPKGTPGHPSRVTITFAELPGGKTEMTFTQSGLESVESRDGHHSGWTEAFDKLASYVARG